MPPDPRAETVETRADSWPDVEAVLDSLTETAQSPVGQAEFCQQLVSCAVAAIAGEAGRVWISEPAWRIGANLGFPEQAGFSPARQQAAAQNGVSFARGAAIGWDSNPDGLWAAAAVRLDDQTVALLEVVSDDRDNASLRQVLESILSAITEIAAEYFTRQDRRRLRQAADGWEQVERFIEQCHAPWGWRATTYTIANEAAALLACDRVTVLRRTGGGRYRAEAISGVDVMDRRSNQVRSLEKLAAAASTLEQPAWCGVAFAAEEDEALFQKHIDLTHYRAAAITPLVKDGRRADVMAVVEFLGRPADETATRRRFETFTRHGGSAAARALRLDRQPLRRVSAALEWLGLGGSLGNLAKLFVAVALLATLAILAFTMETDFEINARGELQPAVQRRVFAPADGSIADIHVRRGDRVAAGDELLRMSDSGLDFDETRLAGEVHTAETELLTVRTERLKSKVDDRDDLQRQSELAAREEQLVRQLANLEQQRKILARKRAELSVASPITGQVITGDIRHDLATRPVKRGQRLLVVAATESEWEIRLQVSDERIGHVIAARTASEDLAVRFMLASDPGRMYEGRVTKIAMAAEGDVSESPTVQVTVAFDRRQVPELHVGADVAARIVCGRRSYAYCWLHGVYERIRLQFFL